MNILILTTIGEEAVLYGQHRDETIGGLEGTIVLLTKELSSKGHKVILTCCARGYFYDEAKENDLNVKVISARWIKLLGSRLFPLLSLKEIWKEIKKNNIEIIHAANFSAGLIGGIAGRLSRTPVLISIHQRILLPNKNFNPNIFKSSFSKLKFSIIMFMRKISSKLANKIIVVSDFVKDDLIVNGFDRKKIITVLNGIKVDNFNPYLEVCNIRKEFHVDNNCFIVGTINRLDKFKGIQYFIEAYEIIKKQIDNIKFIIVGDGPERQNLQKMTIYKKYKENIIFTGFKKDVQKLLALFNIFVQPSLAEGFGRVIIEAMAMKKPVIATDACGNTRVLYDHENILIIKSSDACAIANAIIELYRDPQLCEKISQNARKFVEANLNSEIWCNKYLDIYRELLI